MGKIGVIYWSGTGNTEAMAELIAKGIRAVEPDCDVMTVSETTASNAIEYEKLVLGCPAMGSEELEEDEVEPFMAELEGLLSGKKVALFGSYGWGDGEWMRNWQDRCLSAGADLINGEGFICNEAPEDEDALVEFGKQIANA